MRASSSLFTSSPRVFSTSLSSTLSKCQQISFSPSVLVSPSQVWTQKRSATRYIRFLQKKINKLPERIENFKKTLDNGKVTEENYKIVRKAMKKFRAEDVEEALKSIKQDGMEIDPELIVSSLWLFTEYKKDPLEDEIDILCKNLEKFNIPENSILAARMAKAYAKIGKPEKVKVLKDKAISLGCKETLAENFLLQAHLRSGDSEAAMQQFESMKQRNLITPVTFQHLFRFCGVKKQPELLKQIENHLDDLGMERGVRIYHSLIKAKWQCDEKEEAKKLLENAKKEGFRVLFTGFKI